MDILHLLVVVNLGLTTLLFGALLPDIADDTSILEMILGDQPAVCSSLTNPENQSISDPSVIQPPLISERLNYEYTITTPNFPDNYPTNIHCTTLIKAPSFDFHIVLEMRQKFDIEPSKNCVRDFLEITDGPYGFSKKIGRFCNTETLPKEVTSSGPFLWLRFRSDYSLPHTGFKIVYRFKRNTRIVPRINYCYKLVTISASQAFELTTPIIITELQRSAKFQNNTSFLLECVFDFHVNTNFNTFVHLSIFKKPNNPLPCYVNSIDIYYKGTFDTDVASSRKLNYIRICEETDFGYYLFKHSTRTTVRIVTSDVRKMNSISLIITAVKLTIDKCPISYFLCSNTTMLCISNQLTCNGQVNCPEKTDEDCVGVRIRPAGEERNMTITADPLVEEKEKLKTAENELLKRTNRTHAIILGSISSVLVISMVFCLVLTIHSKKKDKENSRTNIVDVPVYNHNKQQNNKNLFYEPSVAALSNEKLNRKLCYTDNQVWSKRSYNNDASIASAHRDHDSSYKLNGGIKSDFTVRNTTINPFRTKIASSKGSSLNKIGKYLSVPNPAKNEIVIKQTIPNRSPNLVRPYNVVSPSDDFQSWSSNSFSKHNSSTNRSLHNIQRASSMGSGLRRQLQDPVDDDELSKNVEWYCGPVIRGNGNRNNSSETLNAYPAKSSQHVPGCRSLPNFINVGLQNPVYYTKPIPSYVYQKDADSFDCSVDDSSSYRDEEPHTPYNKYNSILNTQNNFGGASTTQYGVRYFCAHQPITTGSDFVEYIA